MGKHRDDVRPFAELSNSGLLWVINRIVFHPRGFALAFNADEAGNTTGWVLLGDGSEPWWFPAEDDREMFQAAEETFRAARDAVEGAKEEA